MNDYILSDFESGSKYLKAFINNLIKKVFDEKTYELNRFINKGFFVALCNMYTDAEVLENENTMILKFKRVSFSILVIFQHNTTKFYVV